MSAALALEAVAISIGGRVLVHQLDLVVKPGEAATVMGASGSGKSTLLAFIGGHLDHAFEARGKVLLGAEDVTAWPPERRRIGILFQDDLLFPHLSVGGNLAFGLSRRIRGRHRYEHVSRALADAGLAGFADRDPATLSGGQKARVSLMRTLLAQPRVLLLDEPFGSLDVTLRAEFRQFVFDHAKARGLPVLLVTHDEADAMAAGGRIVPLSHRRG